MAIFYSKTTRGFYLSEVHGDNRPADCVEITEARYKDLLEGQRQGRMIVPGADGSPTTASVEDAQEETLDRAIEKQKKRLSFGYTDAQQMGFVSAALGAPHLYGGSLESQIDLGLCERIASATGRDVAFGCTNISDGLHEPIMHTPEQMLQALLDGAERKTALYARYLTLMSQLAQCKTPAEVRQIVWTEVPL